MFLNPPPVVAIFPDEVLQLPPPTNEQFPDDVLQTPPIGIKEKADDIPAMLSNNEFVFTADAVRGAGGGSG